MQYWNAATSAWTTVPGGSVVNNNLVWKKISFAALTTTKIQVVVNLTVDNVARIAEIEAWTPAVGGGSPAQIHWLVTDQLGTPRMIVDQTGSLAGVSRHDYLPFGEEVPGNFRTGIPGYATIDATRPKFTGYERDAESGLDYAQARYYSNLQGRFTSVDPLEKLKRVRPAILRFSLPTSVRD